MAERKTSWTNADLKPLGGPATEYGPWKSVDRQYDDLLNEPSFDEIMSGARNAVASSSAFAAARDRDMQDRSRSFEPATTKQRIGNAVREYTPDVLTKLISPIANAASLPLMGTPAGLPLAGLGAIESLISPDSSMVERGLSLATMLPAAGILAKGAKAGKAATTSSRIWPKDMYRRQATEVPYRMDGAVAQRPSMLSMSDDVPGFSVVDDAPIPQGPATMDEVMDLERSIPDIVSRNAPTKMPGNVVRQRGTADIESELRAAGGSEKDVRQLYHTTQSQGRGVRVEGLGKRLSNEERRIQQLLTSLGMGVD
jgi:hypothetical protein